MLLDCINMSNTFYIRKHLWKEISKHSLRFCIGLREFKTRFEPDRFFRVLSFGKYEFLMHTRCKLQWAGFVTRATIIVISKMFIIKIMLVIDIK